MHHSVVKNHITTIPTVLVVYKPLLFIQVSCSLLCTKNPPVFSSIALFSPHSSHLSMGLFMWASMVWIIILFPQMLEYTECSVNINPLEEGRKEEKKREREGDGKSRGKKRR